jgi:hypothetical protein
MLRSKALLIPDPDSPLRFASSPSQSEGQHLATSRPDWVQVIGLNIKHSRRRLAAHVPSSRSHAPSEPPDADDSVLLERSADRVERGELFKLERHAPEVLISAHFYYHRVVPGHYADKLKEHSFGRVRMLRAGFDKPPLITIPAGSPYLHHVKGELLLAQNPSDGVEAERCFRTAIEIARRQSARIAELRATTSLARLLNEQGRGDEARTMLAEIYGWFSEGFDTANLKDAKALLDELSV